MLDDDQRMIGLFEDCHEKECGEATSEFQFSESTMQSAENTRVAHHSLITIEHDLILYKDSREMVDYVRQAP
ncbi:MAG: hypothetical protein LUQ38_07135 [Methanotrichaceae archaeon]|nr:hypothetical protein [Methanotrichaceae archaeon]